MNQEKELPKRKSTRIKNYDYSSPGAYFVTICTKTRENYFWENVGATTGRPQDIILSEHGKIVEEAINNIPIIYSSMSVEEYIIMPDHVHLLLLIRTDEHGRPMVAPTIDRVVKQLKGYVSKRVGTPIWQKLYYDHIVRNREDYEAIVKYIHENPVRWYYKHLDDSK
ncbi:MAG: transposase [Clostridia bacterium]|nr:transposase [Clostridia bacterium]